MSLENGKTFSPQLASGITPLVMSLENGKTFPPQMPSGIIPRFWRKPRMSVSLIIKKPSKTFANLYRKSSRTYVVGDGNIVPLGGALVSS
jgi:hypothetical protein